MRGQANGRTAVGQEDKAREVCTSGLRVDLMAHPSCIAGSTGDIHRYDELCTKHASLLNAQPALVAHERRLREKITILCLMELISSLPPDRRTVALADVAQRTKLPLDGVEFLLMKVTACRALLRVLRGYAWASTPCTCSWVCMSTCLVMRRLHCPFDCALYC